MTPETFTIGGDLEVHRLGFGAMRITGQGIWGEPRDRKSARKVVQHVIELGVDFIDTADAYGPNVSEEILAEALYPYPDGLVIATKGGMERTGPNKWHTNGRPQHLREACEGSLRRLKLDTIDLYQLHAIDDDVPLEDSVGALARLQEEGKIRHVGVSNFKVADIERAREIVDVVTVQDRFNLSDRKYEPVLDYCEAHGIGFIPWRPVEAGTPASREALARIAKKHDATQIQTALAWLLARSPVMLPIPGTSSIEHLEENVAARELTLDAGDVEALNTAH